MTRPAVSRITRNQVVRRWGTPQVTEGSVNEPREREEEGVRFNEKWIYRAPKGDPAQPMERIVYWHRYDFVASFVRDRTGALVREDPRAVVDAPRDDRRWLPAAARAPH